MTPKPSYNCKVSCAYDVEITDGPFAGFIGNPCGRAENMEGAAAVIGVDDPGATVIMTDFYDDMGLESGQFGSILGAVYEAYNDGVLTPQDTDGLDLTWGNWEAAMELIRTNAEFVARGVDCSSMQSYAPPRCRRFRRQPPRAGEAAGAASGQRPSAEAGQRQAVAAAKRKSGLYALDMQLRLK